MCEQNIVNAGGNYNVMYMYTSTCSCRLVQIHVYMTLYSVPGYLQHNTHTHTHTHIHTYTHTHTLQPVHQLPASQQEATCQACQVAKATLVCFQCLPTGFPFCDACSSHEHNRDFPPVQRHSPKLVGAVK